MDEEREDAKPEKKTHLRGGLRKIPRVAQPAAAFMDLAWDEDWRLRSSTDEDRDAGVSFELIFEVKEQQSWLYYVEDLLVGLPYVTAWGPAQESLAQFVGEKLNAWTDEEMMQAWDEARTPDDVGRAVLLLGVAAPPRHSEPFFTRIEAALQYSDEGVRNAAVVAVAYRGWRAFHPILVELEASDPAESVRQRCRVALNNWAEHAEEA